ncbi:hypothetical protein [Pseudogracilibacillus auburnensis]|uniref:hypothetical protein n=1 Tax=Pseudogracilibacillus auburnensis TaxID=1494959 RepID=UPI001A9574B9|nr:hypothetical protein [Pseudogracilibacillus auburnensis]MBO1001902.1 hypothetical protein [Pseudogracilibacillus auburnensis]
MNNNLCSLFEQKKVSIIVSLPENRVDLAKAAIDAGADALKFHINVNHRASGNEFKNVDHYIDVFTEIRELYDGPLGLVLSDDVNKVNQLDLKKLKNIGFTYFSLYAKDITSKLLLQKELEQTVAVDDLFQPDHVKAIEHFDMKAVELSVVKKEDYGKPLNFEDITLYRNYREKTDLPIIIPSQKRLVPEDLDILHQIGVQSVMLGAVTIGTTEKSIYETVYAFTQHASHVG